MDTPQNSRRVTFPLPDPPRVRPGGGRGLPAVGGTTVGPHLDPTLETLHELGN